MNSPILVSRCDSSTVNLDALLIYIGNLSLGRLLFISCHWCCCHMQFFYRILSFDKNIFFLYMSYFTLLWHMNVK